MEVPQIVAELCSVNGISASLPVAEVEGVGYTVCVRMCGACAVHVCACVCWRSTGPCSGRWIILKDFSWKPQ